MAAALFNVLQPVRYKRIRRDVGTSFEADSAEVADLVAAGHLEAVKPAATSKPKEPKEPKGKAKAEEPVPPPGGPSDAPEGDGAGSGEGSGQPTGEGEA